jgi:hypothetical protein
VTPQNKALTAAIAALALAVATAVGAKLWLAKGAGATLTAPIDSRCDLHTGPCTSTIPGGGRIELSVAPRPIPLLRPININVRVNGLEARTVEVDFAGESMYMGFNRRPMQRQGDGSYTGSTVLPVCVTGSMAWLASVIVDTGKGKVVAPFRFITAQNEP